MSWRIRGKYPIVDQILDLEGSLVQKLDNYMKESMIIGMFYILTTNRVMIKVKTTISKDKTF